MNNTKQTIIFKDLNRQINLVDLIHSFYIQDLKGKFLPLNNEGTKHLYEKVIILVKLNNKESVISDIYNIYENINNKGIDLKFLDVNIYNLTKKYGKYNMFAQYVYSAIYLLMNEQNYENLSFAQDLTLFSIYQILYNNQEPNKMANYCRLSGLSSEQKHLVMNHSEFEIKKSKKEIKKILDK